MITNMDAIEKVRIHMMLHGSQHRFPLETCCAIVSVYATEAYWREAIAAEPYAMPEPQSLGTRVTAQSKCSNEFWAWRSVMWAGEAMWLAINNGIVYIVFWADLIKPSLVGEGAGK